MSVQNQQIEKFLRRMLVMFGEPDTSDLDAYLDEYRDVLEGLSSKGLDHVWAAVRDTHKRRGWPHLAEVRAAVKSSGDATYHNPTGDLEKRFKGWLPADIERADRMCRSAIGEQAQREGWLGGLHSFIAKNNRYPNGSEQAEIVDNARFVDRCAAGVVNMGLAHSALLALARSMVERRNKIAARVWPEAKGAHDSAKVNA